MAIEDDIKKTGKREEKMDSKSLVRVEKTKDQLVPAGTWRKILYQKVSVDRRGEWDMENQKYIAKSEGYYFAFLSFSYHATGKGAHPFWGAIHKNSVEIHAQTYAHQTGSGCPFGTCAALIHMEEGDYIEAWTANCHQGKQVLRFRPPFRRNLPGEDKLMQGAKDETDIQKNNLVIYSV